MGRLPVERPEEREETLPSEVRWSRPLAVVVVREGSRRRSVLEVVVVEVPELEPQEPELPLVREGFLEPRQRPPSEDREHKLPLTRPPLAVPSTVVEVVGERPRLR